MAGTWESQNKVIPGAYINLQTNTPLSITAGDRGTVVIAQELSVGTDNAIYEITASAANYPVQLAIDSGVSPVSASLLSWVIVFAGGFLANFVYSSNAGGIKNRIF